MFTDITHALVPTLKLRELTSLRGTSREHRREADENGWWAEVVKTVISPTIQKMETAMPPAYYKAILKGYMQPLNTPHKSDYEALIKLTKNFCSRFRTKKTTEDTVTTSAWLTTTILRCFEDHKRTQAGRIRLRRIALTLKRKLNDGRVEKDNWYVNISKSGLFVVEHILKTHFVVNDTEIDTH